MEGIIKKKRIIITSGIVVVMLVLVVYIGGSIYFANSMMTVSRTPLDKSITPEGLIYEDISFTSRNDGVNLKGWYILGDTEFTVLIVNGGGNNRVDQGVGTLEICGDLIQRGYNVLIFDMRGRGESEGEGLFLTNVEHDIGGAVDYIKSRGIPDDNIGILGFSLGAISSIIIASESNVACLVSDSAFAYVSDAFLRKVPKQFGVPKLLVQIVNPGAFLMAKLIYGYEVRNPSDKVKNVECPTLFIQGDSDDLAYVEDTYKLLKASNNPLDEIWVLPGVGHTQGYKLDPAAYIDKVSAFFDNNFAKNS